MEHGRRNRRLTRTAGVPQQRARRRIVRVDPFGRVDDELVVAGGRDDEGGTVGDTSVAAVRLPSLLSRAGIEREQIRVRLVIAEEDQEAAVEDR
jgi:hypothetical protein